ncbi:MAG: hypothetical protein LC768_08160 [Acidobacteria bacterium]|nr:hypothetical protein [Acidobacteriota bacterium]MCA1638294.1 hypothetical protein [Acidobacteriota bacterium]
MEKLSEERLKKIGELFRNPRPGSKVAAAKEFGVDLTLLARNLTLTPEERINEMLQAVEDTEFFSGEMKKSLRSQSKK